MRKSSASQPADSVGLTLPIDWRPSVPKAVLGAFTGGNKTQPSKRDANHVFQFESERTQMSVTDQYLENNKKYAEGFSGPLPLPPKNQIAVLACMDARLNVHAALGIAEGESHVIRNAGGVVTDDEIRSLSISQRLLGTKEIILIHHTDCGMLTFTDDSFKKTIQEEIGLKPEWAAEAFDDLEVDVRQSIARIKQSPFIPHTDNVRGFIFDVSTGLLNEVD
jgi:carbonic anhydrase